MAMDFADVYKGKTVLVTGHTGFKGSWLSEWLLLLGAKVVGFSLDPPTQPSHFDALGLGESLAADVRDDVRSLEALQATLAEHRPEIIFHLAAQPLVRKAFDEPHVTIETNVMGSLNLLEAVRRQGLDCIVVMITTDKVYENVEWTYAYRETDALGGHDPYSASKACAEVLISSYQRSFFASGRVAQDEPTIAVAIGRGGNVIGGGDWAEDRIVPDSIRSLARGKRIPVRNRVATRPWQHVLELLSGYLHLGAECMRAIADQDHTKLEMLCSPFNFGPHITSNKTVEELVLEILKHWPGGWKDQSQPDAKHEAGRLNLTIDKAYHALGWQPRWSFEETVQHTVEWYREYYEATCHEAGCMREMTRQQIRAYSANAS
ncbi:MAG: CDP-glucose 4,6-dehydratase [Thermoanaerobaculia bacterium]|nr:CDP-glucose 4,6-dehydratase [Thermoanaerobaculia bacterium]